MIVAYFNLGVCARLFDTASTYNLLDRNSLNKLKKIDYLKAGIGML